MHRLRVWTAGIGLLVLGQPAWGADLSSRVRPVAEPVPSAAAVRALAESIDRSVAARWEQAQVQPAAPADDAEYLRRVCLDLAGKIPTVAEARDFLDDPAADKRAKLVKRLLASPAYSARMADIWKALLLPESSSNFQVQYFATDFDVWLRRRFAENAGYDRMVREILTATIGGDRRNFVPIGQGTPTPFAFYAAKDGKPENLAASTARLFLGVRLECAQCHDHPFAKWKREQFWGYAAFFGGVDRTSNDESLFQARELADRRELAIPGTDRVAQASFLDGTEPRWRPKVGSRAVLADWVTSPENPYFARAAVNRLWAQFFGTGLVDPVDDLGGEVKASHPELFDELARQFADHGFDLKFLLRAITASRAYQLTSAGYAPGQDDPHLFARMPVRGLTPQQLYDSLAQAAGLRREPDQPPFFFGNSPRKAFLDRFANQEEKPTERQTSILQSLTLMNGQLVAEATDLDRGGTLAAVADSYFLDTPGKVEVLYLAALSRRPRPEELERLAPYVDRGGPTLNPRKALADVFWALLNSAEFIANH